jgi:hypothetical protein
LNRIYTKIDLNTCELVADHYDVSTELLNWLKDSCIKTKSGDDLICFHGSPSNEKFAIFNDNTSYGCKSFVGFFSLNFDFAECYTYSTEDDGESSPNRVRSFVINSKKLFDIKNPVCVRFLRTHLPDTISCNGDVLDKASFVDYLRTEQVQVNNYKLTTNKFAGLKIFDTIGMDILGNSGWEHSCTLENDKQLQNAYFLNTNPGDNSVFILTNNTRIRPKITERKYCWPNTTEGILLYQLGLTFDRAVSAGILTDTHLSTLAQGKSVNIKLSAEEFINVCVFDSVKKTDLTEKERQTLRDMLDNPAYSDLDLSVDVMLVPKKISLDEFSQGLAASGGKVANVDNTWELYEDSYCIIDGQKIHILDWLKSEGFDAVVVKEGWAVNIICLYKNMIKDLYNSNPTDSDSVFEKYNYSDALLADLL